ncbi:MAG: SpoIIE family protein phosphatase [Mycobacteriaceae bacterium]
MSQYRWRRLLTPRAPPAVQTSGRDSASTCAEPRGFHVIALAVTGCDDGLVPVPGVPSWTGDLGHLDGLDEAALVTDSDGQIVFANATARRLYRFLGPDLVGLRLDTTLVRGDSRGALAEIIDQVLSGVFWSGRLDVIREDGTVRTADVSCSPLSAGGVIRGLVCVVDDTGTERGQAREARRLRDRLTRLARVATDLGAAEDAESVAKVVTSQAADAVGATVASLSLVIDDNTLALTGIRGAAEDTSARWATYSLHDQTPAGEVARTGRPLVLVGRQAIRKRYPTLESAAPGQRSMVALPLRVLGQTIGVITLSFPGRRELEAAELDFFAILADSCAQALERIRAQDAAAKQAARVKFLADATTQISKSLDYQGTLAEVARLAVPDFADWCAIDVLEDDRLHRLAVEHVDPAKIRVAIDLEQRYPADPDAPVGPWQVIRSGESLLIPEVTDEMLVSGAQDEQHLRLTRQLELRSVLMVPLSARGKVLGVLTWVMAESGRRYTEADLAFAEDLGRRAAIAIDNSQLHSQTREASIQLQHAVLPRLPDRLPGWGIASSYSPAGRTEVGGDFYDVIPLPDGRLAAFVGDVMGRGVAAAAAMAQMRSAMRAYIAVDPAPERVFVQLDRLFSTYPMSQLVTLVYLVADPASDMLHAINAGHPPPVILRHDGRVDQLPPAGGPPFGATLDGRTASPVDLRVGDTVLAFTDGLIERRDEDIDSGQTRLLRSLQALNQSALRDGLESIVNEVRDHSREDDVAALALRRMH